MSIIRTSRVLYKDKLAFWLTNVSFLFILATWALFFVKKIKHDPLAVLHFNIYAGIDTLGPWHWLYTWPAIVLVISVIDFVLAVLLWTRVRVMSYFLLATIMIINIFMFLFLYNILNYNL
ncbi:MAG: hypothetical protein HOC78_03305 [Candidatus Komeilibacteria bacterium]|jgi:hypothetical protein|nr:hypothetical protein [Candidatus Komeilibacteria bacterium]